MQNRIPISRGSDNYNLRLSDRRTRATVQYIISKVLLKIESQAKGWEGLSQRVSCTNCSEEEHAQNRRSEFLIVKKVNIEGKKYMGLIPHYFELYSLCYSTENYL